jgi:hypothetical protein
MNTSHNERFNLTIRIGMRRFTRLTNGFSKSTSTTKRRLPCSSCTTNFCAMHGTIKTTPAQAAGLTDRQWTIAEMLEVVANYRKPEVAPPTLKDLIDRLPSDN